MKSPNIIVITGASSGIGAALAAAYARPNIILGLLGRSEDRLNEVSAACAAKGATVKTGLIDVRDKERMRLWLAAFDAAHPIDLLIANAGVAAGFAGEGESDAQVRDIFAINVEGVLNSVLPAVSLMQPRGRGQIAIMSSVAGIRGLPSCPAYSASKNAVRALGEGLRGSLSKSGVEVSVICPGFIRTPMTDANSFPMPMIISAEKAAKIIIRGLARNAPRIAFPRTLYFALLLTTWLPLRLTDPFFAALPKKTIRPS